MGILTVTQITDSVDGDEEEAIFPCNNLRVVLVAPVAARMMPGRTNKGDRDPYNPPP